MQLELSSIRRRFVFWMVFALMAALFAGYCALAWLRLIPDLDFIRSAPALLWLLSDLGLAGVAVVYFWGVLGTLCDSASRTPPAPATPDVHRSLARLSPHYWVFLLAYVLIASLLNFWGIGQGMDANGEVADLALLANIALVQLTVTLLIGVPSYLMAMTALGGLIARLGLDKVQITVQSKLMLTGLLLPMLAGVIMAYTTWRSAGFLAPEVLVVWGVLLVYLLLTMALGARSLLQSFYPLNKVLSEGQGESRYLALTQLRPMSSDEVGYFTQMVGRLSRLLYKQDRRVRAVIESAPEGIIVVNAEGLIVSINPAALRLFGYKEDEIRHSPLAKLLPCIVTEAGVPRLSADEQLSQGMRSSGENVPVAVRVGMSQAGGKNLYTCFLTDVSPRLAAMETLLRAEAHYRELVEGASDLVWTLDTEGRWTFVNDAAKSIYGYEPQEMLGRAYLDFVAPEFIEREKASLAELMRGKERLEYDTVHLHKDGTPRQLGFIAQAIKDPEGSVTQLTGSARDITERKAQEQKLTYQVAHDPLTGLFNRQYFQQELDRLVARVVRGGTGGAIMFVDLDQLKMINDSVGHAGGDRLLVEASKVMKAHIREGDLLARYGGDEFTILLYNVDAENALRVAENLRARFNDYRFIEGGSVYDVTCSIGVAMIADGVLSASDCLTHAERACNLAKTQGRNQVCMYEPAEGEVVESTQEIGWGDRIRELIERDSIEFVYQPIVALSTGGVYDYEVFARLVDKEGRPINPGGFLPTVERLGLGGKLDRLVVSKNLEHLAALRKAGYPVRFSINLSSHAFEDADLVPAMGAALKAHGLDGSVLTVEITETAAITDLTAVASFIAALKDIGVQVALDHFGAGFSSFTYLKQLAVDKLKINHSYIQGLPKSVVNQAVIRSMNQVAHAMGKSTVAGFVESKDVLDLLRDLGVDFAQGHYIAKPDEKVNKDRFMGVSLH